MRFRILACSTLFLGIFASELQAQKLREFAGPQGNAVAFSPDGKTVASMGADGAVHLFDVTAGKELRKLISDASVAGWSLAFTPDGKRLAVAGMSNDVRLFDVATGRETDQLQGHTAVVWSVAFSPDGRFIVSGSEDATVGLWDAASGKLIRFLTGAPSGVWPVAFAPDSKTVVALDSSGNLHHWDAATGKVLRSFQALGGSAWPVAFSSDNRTVASAAWGMGPVVLWDLTSGRKIGEFGTNPGSGWALAFAPDGRTLAIAGKDGSVQLWEVASGKERQRIDAHQGGAQAVAFAPDGRSLLTAGPDALRLWDVSGRLDDKGRLRAAALSEGEAAALWEDLARGDARKAGQAIWTLTAAPQRTLALLRARLRPPDPPPAADVARIGRLIDQLDDDDFATRDKAFQELGKLGEAAGPALRRALEGSPTAEAKRRIEELVERLDGQKLTPEELRAVRALEVLEQMHTPEARALLRKLAGGPAGNRLTIEAKIAVRRAGKLP